MQLIAPGKTSATASVWVTPTTPTTVALYTSQGFAKADHNRHLDRDQMLPHRTSA